MKECEGSFYASVTIANDWTNDPSANPEGMAYFFFPVAGGAPWRFDIPGRDGGEIKIPTGAYDCLLFNDDMTNALESDDKSFDTMTLHTPEGPLFPGCDKPADYPPPVAVLKQTAHLNPDRIWCYSIKDVKVVLTHEKQTILTMPYPVTATYHVAVKKIGNLNGVRSMSAALSGMAESLEISDRMLSRSAMILPCLISKMSDQEISGTFHTFGRCSDSSIPNILYLFFMLSDGKRYVYDFNVTEIVKSAPDPMNVFIEIEGFDLPESGSSDTGAFHISVDGWNNITIPL